MKPRDVLIIVLFVLASLLLSPAICAVFFGLVDAFSQGMPAVFRILIFLIMSTAASGFVLSIALMMAGRRSYSLPGGAIGGLIFSLIELVICSF